MKIYNYRIKIINPHKRSDFVTRKFHNHHKMFESVRELKSNIRDEFGESVPDNDKFQVGYFIGKHSAKHWLVTQSDLSYMYESITKTNILLWCDARSTIGNSPSSENDLQSQSKKHRSTATSTSVLSNKVDIEETVTELQEAHKDKYSLPKLRQWARMVAAGHHDSLIDPPRIPAITGSTAKSKKKQAT